MSPYRRRPTRCAVRRSLVNTALGIVMIAAMTVSLGVLCAEYRVDLSGLYYQDDAGRDIRYNGSGGLIKNGDLYFPEAAIVSRPPAEIPIDPTGNPITCNNTTDSIYHPPYCSMYALEDKRDIVLSLATDDEHCSLTSSSPGGGFTSLGSSGWYGGAGTNWQLTVTLTNFRYTDPPEGYSPALVIGASSSSPAVSPWILGAWVKGWYNGSYHERLFGILAGIEDDTKQESWETDILFLGDVDPANATIDMRIEVQDGRTVIASYKVDKGSWVEIGRRTTSSNRMKAFYNILPYIELTADQIEGPPPPNLCWNCLPGNGGWRAAIFDR